MDTSTLVLGSDPEIFLVNPEGKHIAINGFINAGKQYPLQVPNAPEGFTLQEDNVALEYGIPPAKSAEEFVAHIKYVMERSREWIPQNLSFSKLSCTIFEKDQLQHPKSRVFGCEPDFNAYTGEKNPKPRPKHQGLRSAGGHIHVGLSGVDPIRGTKSMDLHLGIPSLLMDEGEERRQLYGMPGAFRYKPYGFEYRTLSNFWIFEDKYIRWAFNNSKRAMEQIEAIDYLDDVEEVIKTNNKQRAEEIVREFNLELV